MDFNQINEEEKIATITSFTFLLLIKEGEKN